MIIPLYDISIDSSEYNLDINSTCTVTVQCIDKEGNPVIGKSLTVKSILGNLDGNKSVTSITNSNGVISLTYTPLTWGIDTVKCEDCSVNIRVKGYKSLSQSVSSNISIRYNDKIVEVNMNNFKPSSSTGATFLGQLITDANLYPKGNVTIPLHASPGHCSIVEDGRLFSFGTGATSSGQHMLITYAYK